ncbi:alpha/beta fold hydrolase [Temperatibacter marinus]|uniref:Alpha/beta fold hydrolase n=1 Tax=Temperatibacter marinus TaxID=1456591 RepID=A0AA52H8K1_9PROT|nr:alpha/beta fold hydrolase [Temperatibacter marinus]WND02211.1 alpha/beta fold hydrolase [Temperatibacter marinus]
MTSLLSIQTDSNVLVPLYENTIDHASDVILILPAMGVRASFYKALSNSFKEHQIANYILEQRGQGRSIEKPSRHSSFGYKDYILNDLMGAIEHIKHKHPKAKIHCIGHSLGGHMALTLKALKPCNFDNLILCASGSPYIGAFKGKQYYGGKFLCFIAPMLISILGYFPGQFVGFAGKEYPQLFRDWLNLARDDHFNFKGLNDNIEAQFKRIEGNILCFSFQEDDFAPITASLCFLDRLDLMEKKVVSVTSDDIGVKADHFSWAKSPEFIVSKVKQWLQETPN